MPKLPPPRAIVQPVFAPYWQTADQQTVRLYLGHVVHVLNRLPAESVQCVVTSPPYWGLRDYGTGTWEGGNTACDHATGTARQDGGRASVDGFNGSTKEDSHKGIVQYKQLCGKCGAKRVDMQLGSEPSPDCGTQGQAQCGRCFVCSMVAVFRAVRRVLRDDGTLWMNLGDTYSGGGGGNYGTGKNAKHSDGSTYLTNVHNRNPPLPPGNLVGIPWRVALALQADGWVLRQDVIWHKPSPMPESVRNRCTKAHEYVFLLTKKGSGYYYDSDAIKEGSMAKNPKTYSSEFKTTWVQSRQGDKATGRIEEDGGKIYGCPDTGRNKRSVWAADDEQALAKYLQQHEPDAWANFLRDSQNKGDTWKVSSQGYEGAHFATFPPALIEPCIKAGTSEYGCCGACGAPFQRLTEERKLTRTRPNEYVKRTGEEGTGNSCANTVAGVQVKTVGWGPTCECSLTDGNAIAPCVVLDPFIGSGTTAVVCLELERRCWGIDLSQKYLDNNAIVRIKGDLYSRPALAWLAK